MNAMFKPSLLSTPYYARFAATVAVMDLTADAISVKCQIYLETGIPVAVEAGFNGDHADPYITAPCAYLLMFVGDNENRLVIDLDEDAKRGIALAIEQELVKEHLSRTTPPESISKFCY